MKISDSIKKFRKAKRLTQQELADNIDRSLRMVQKYESGEVEPSIEVLNAIGEVLGDDFFNNIDLKNARLSIGENSIKLKTRINLSSDLVKDIISSLSIDGYINKSFFIGDDLEVLTNNIKDFIINQTKIITDKNFLLMDALNNPDKFYEEYMSNED